MSQQYHFVSETVTNQINLPNRNFCETANSLLKHVIRTARFSAINYTPYKNTTKQLAFRRLSEANERWATCENINSNAFCLLGNNYDVLGPLEKSRRNLFGHFQQGRPLKVTVVVFIAGRVVTPNFTTLEGLIFSGLSACGRTRVNVLKN